jgi:antitoxin component YwqK of YwqJK toxin-antitoxin module
MNTSAPASAPNTTFYANGQKQFEFQPSGQGGQAGQYSYYDENGKKFLSENKSANGRVCFEHEYNKDGTTSSTTIHDPNGGDHTTVYK